MSTATQEAPAKAPTTSAAIATTNGAAPVPAKQPKTVREWITTDSFKNEVSRALPKHCTPDRFLRVALTALTTTPKLADCTPTSVCSSLLRLSQFGLEADGRRAHLIPYGNQCQLIVDYKGLAELVLRSGLVSYLHADKVCENDVFDYDLGEVKRHTIDFKKPRGATYAFYAVCRFKDGTAKADVMTIDEVKAIQGRSKAGRSGPWVTDFDEMGKKTVFRRLSKWLPLSSEIRAAAENDDDIIDINATPAAAPVNGLAALVEAPTLPPEEMPPAEPVAVLTGTTTTEYTDADREKAIDALKNRILDGTTEKAILKQAKAQGLIGATFDGGLFELPTADLVQIVAKGVK